MKTVGLILAAGRSTRFGAADKLLAGFNGKPLCGHIADAMDTINLDDKIAVVSNDAVGEIFKGYRLIKSEGLQSDSLKRGIKAAKKLGAERVLIALADMPFVTTEVLQGLLEYSHSDICALTDGCKKSVPAVFGTSTFETLLNLTGDHGAKSLLHPLKAENLFQVESRVLTDIDTVSDLEHPRPDPADRQF